MATDNKQASPHAEAGLDRLQGFIAGTLERVRPLLAPNRADEGFLLPIGGHKGCGLALVVIEPLL